MRANLPSVDDRVALGQAIVDGEIENLYTPVGSDQYNICIPGLPAWVDQRIALTTWAKWQREGRDIPATMLEEAEARAAAALEYTTRCTARAGCGAPGANRRRSRRLGGLVAGRRA